MKEYPQNLKGIFMTIPLDITPEILAVVGAGDVVVNLNHHNPKTLVFEKKKSDGGGIVNFSTSTKTVTFKVEGTDLDFEDIKQKIITRATELLDKEK